MLRYVPAQHKSQSSLLHRETMNKKWNFQIAPTFHIATMITYSTAYL